LLLLLSSVLQKQADIVHLNAKNIFQNLNSENQEGRKNTGCHLNRKNTGMFKGRSPDIDLTTT
jgi:hypothetical protein